MARWAFVAGGPVGGLDAGIFRPRGPRRAPPAWVLRCGRSRPHLPLVLFFSYVFAARVRSRLVWGHRVSSLRVGAPFLRLEAPLDPASLALGRAPSIFL